VKTPTEIVQIEANGDTVVDTERDGVPRSADKFGGSRDSKAGGSKKATGTEAEAAAVETIARAMGATVVDRAAEDIDRC
jgi:hypothetical protein